VQIKEPGAVVSPIKLTFHSKFSVGALVSELSWLSGLSEVGAATGCSAEAE
jgi:hypothetical protein